VKHIEKYAASIKAKKEILVVKEAVHDLFLSAPVVRQNVVVEIINWIDRIFPDIRNKSVKN
jgi:alpha-beta hydrolase superfamily lysophospholipase